jgi:hypothetical protein
MGRKGTISAFGFGFVKLDFAFVNLFWNPLTSKGLPVANATLLIGIRYQTYYIIFKKDVKANQHHVSIRIIYQIEHSSTL